MVFSHAYRLRRADGNGAPVEYRFVSRAASALFLLRLAFAIVRPVIGDIRPVPRIAGRGGRAGRLCLLAAVGLFGPVSFLSSACSFLAHRHLLGRERFPAVSSCLLCLVHAVYRSALRRGRSPRSSCVGMWGASSCFVSVVSPYRLRLVPRAVWLLVSLLFVIRPVLRHDGRGVALRLSSSAGSSLVLVACRAWGGAARFRVRMVCYHFGSFLPWWRAVWIMWLGGLLAVPMVYWYCQLIVYIVRLDF